MKRKITAGVLSAILLLSSVGVASAVTGAQNGNHYSLNIIGVQNPKSATMDGSNGHTIFVPLNDVSKIELQQGADFQVLDANATDGEAIFQLPDPGLDPYRVGQDMTNVDTTSDYSVYVRPLGKPGGWTTITTCADLLDSSFAGLLSGDFLKVLNRKGAFGGYASIEQVGQDVTMRTKGKTTFTNVTAELTTIVFKVEVQLNDGTTAIDYVRVPIFDPILDNEYWEYDNNGLKNLQVRFYPVGTDVSTDDLLLN